MMSAGTAAETQLKPGVVTLLDAAVAKLT